MSCMSYMSYMLNMSYMIYLTCMAFWQTPYVCMSIWVSKETLGPQECIQPSYIFYKNVFRAKNWNILIPHFSFVFFRISFVYFTVLGLWLFNTCKYIYFTKSTYIWLFNHNTCCTLQNFENITFWPPLLCILTTCSDTGIVEQYSIGLDGLGLLEVEPSGCEVPGGANGSAIAESDVLAASALDSLDRIVRHGVHTRPSLPSR